MEENKNFFENLAEDAKKVNLEPEAELVRTSAVTSRKREELENAADDEGQLAIDVYQADNEIVIESPIAGVDPENIEISITPESVTIKGRRERERHVRAEDYVYQECYWGRFSRAVVLPHEVDADKAEASIKNGVLTIRLPKINRSKSKKLKVRTE